MKKENITIWLPPDLKGRLTRLAEQAQRGRSGFCVDLIEQALDAFEGGNLQVQGRLLEYHFNLLHALLLVAFDDYNPANKRTLNHEGRKALLDSYRGKAMSMTGSILRDGH